MVGRLSTRRQRARNLSMMRPTCIAISCTQSLDADINGHSVRIRVLSGVLTRLLGLPKMTSTLYAKSARTRQFAELLLNCRKTMKRT